MRLKELALACALRDAWLDMGETEGNNRGPYIRRLAANIDPPMSEGLPWCAMAVQSWWDTCADALDLDNPLDDVKLEALVQSYFDYFESYQVHPSEAEPGDLVLFKFNDSERWNHIGLLVKPPTRHLFWTVEGNTSAENQRDGDAVEIKSRQLGRYPVCFIDPDPEDWE